MTSSFDPPNSDGDFYEEGPVVRAYALTKGRTGGTIDLMAVVVATGAEVPHRANLTLEHRRLLALLAKAQPLVDVAADARLPVGVVRVLIGDLIEHQLAQVRPRNANVSEGILREVINGLRAL